MKTGIDNALDFLLNDSDADVKNAVNTRNLDKLLSALSKYKVVDFDYMGFRIQDLFAALILAGVDFITGKRIPYQFLEYTEEVRAFNIPNDCEKIEAEAFTESELRSIDIPDSVKVIEHAAFYNCYGLASVNFGEDSKCETIGAGCFQDCRTLKSITLPKNILTLEPFCFKNCLSLQDVKLNDNLSHIGGKSFVTCSKLRELVIPENVKYIGEYAFAGSGLKQLEFKNSYVTFHKDAFAVTRNLEKIIIPESSSSGFIAELRKHVDSSVDIRRKGY